MGVESCHFPLGFVSDLLTTSQRLFDGFFALDEMGANLIAVEMEDRELFAIADFESSS